MISEVNYHPLKQVVVDVRDGGILVGAGFSGYCDDCPGGEGSATVEFFSVYYGIPRGIPARSALSTSQVKNGTGDPRECAVTTCHDTQGTAGDPINTRTGGFDYSLVDLSVPTVSGPLLFQRTYSSLATEIYTTTLGSGWTHNHDTRLIFPSDPGGEADVVWFKAHTANQYRFDITAPDTFTPYPGVLASLEGDAVNGYTLVDASHNTYVFDGQGRLLSWNDAQGHAFTYTYSNNLLSRVSDPTGQRYLDFQYWNTARVVETSSDSAMGHRLGGYVPG